MATRTKPRQRTLTRRAPNGDIAYGKKPLYEQVGDIIRQRLNDNVWRPGEAIPSEMQLAAELGVSQGTVRTALDDLVAENLLARRQGLGTFVCEHTERRALFLYFNLVRRDGSRMLPLSELVSCRQVKATAAERERLGLAAGDLVVRFSRVRRLHEVPVIVERIALPQRLFPDLGKGKMPPNHLYRFYQTEYGITVAKADEEASAVAATAAEAKRLQLQPGAPLLLIDRIAYSAIGEPIEWRQSRCNTQEYRYISQRG